MRHSYLSEEKKLWKKGYQRIACLDEAGRGCLAGPVVAAAVLIRAIGEIHRRFSEIIGLKDSKKLTPQKREEFFELITRNPAIKWQTAKVSEKVIDKINIKNASELAMLRAVQKLKPRPNFLIIDGKFLKNSKLKNIKYKLIVKADEKVFSCTVASVIAKVSRDRIMLGYHKKFPQYGFSIHKGYPTKLHLTKLKKYGPCKIHRKSFRPVFRILKIKNKR